MPPSIAKSTATLQRGPRGHALLGSLRDLNRDQLGFYTRCAREHGDVVPVRLGPFPALLIYHPDAIEEVLVTRNRDFIKSRGIRLMRAFLGDGLFTAEGDLWLHQRRLMQPAFHRQRIAAYGETMATYAVGRAADWNDGAVLDIHEEMMGITRAIVAKTLFDADVSEEARAVGDASEIVTEFFGERLGSLRAQLLPLWLPTPANLGRRRRQPDDRPAGAGRGHDAFPGRSRDHRGDPVLDLVSHRPAPGSGRATRRRAAGRARGPAADGGRSAGPALHRDGRAGVHAPLPARVRDRTGSGETDRGGRTPGTGGRHRDHADVGGASRRPLVRRVRGVPERWAHEAIRRLPRFAYFPFGGGPRQCIGNTFATMEATLILAAIAQRFRLALIPGQRVTPTPYITLRPEPGISMRVEQR